jgi:hypothetical protein
MLMAECKYIRRIIPQSEKYVYNSVVERFGQVGAGIGISVVHLDPD